MGIPVRNVTTRGLQRVREALDILRAVAPVHHAHFFQEIREVVYDPYACDGGVACTAGRYGRKAVLARDPETEDVGELAISLSHEARHHSTDAYGQHWIIPHTCADCSDPGERALDAIYQEDERLRDALRAFLAPVPTGNEGPSFVEGLLKVAGVGLLAFAGVALVGAIADALGGSRAA